MKARHASRVARAVAVFPGAALLAVSVAPKAAALSELPRFDRADCLLNGEWTRNVRRECGWLVVPESRDRPTANTVRLAVEIFRAKEPSGAPPLVLLLGRPGRPERIRILPAGGDMQP